METRPIQRPSDPPAAVAEDALLPFQPSAWRYRPFQPCFPVNDAARRCHCTWLLRCVDLVERFCAVNNPPFRLLRRRGPAARKPADRPGGKKPVGTVRRSGAVLRKIRAMACRRAPHRSTEMRSPAPSASSHRPAFPLPEGPSDWKHLHPDHYKYPIVLVTACSASTTRSHCLHSSASVMNSHRSQPAGHSLKSAASIR